MGGFFDFTRKSLPDFDPTKRFIPSGEKPKAPELPKAPQAADATATATASAAKQEANSAIAVSNEAKRRKRGLASTVLTSRKRRTAPTLLSPDDNSTSLLG